MILKTFSFTILVTLFFSCFSSATRTVYDTYFINTNLKKKAYNVTLATKDSLDIYATIKLSGWESGSWVANKDSIRNNAKKNCTLIVELHTNNKGKVFVKDFDIQLFCLGDSSQTDSLIFTNFCKKKRTKYFDLSAMDCFNSKTALKENLYKVEVEQAIKTKLLLRQELNEPKVFEQKRFYAKIRLVAVYNDWAVNINFKDTITRNEIVSYYGLHP